MAKKRVYEIAKEEGLPSALLLQRLQRAGVSVKTASSTVEVAEALYVINPNKHPKPDGMPEPGAQGSDTPPDAKVKETPKDESAAEEPQDSDKPHPRPRPRPRPRSRPEDAERRARAAREQAEAAEAAEASKKEADAPEPAAEKPAASEPAAEVKEEPAGTAPAADGEAVTKDEVEAVEAPAEERAAPKETGDADQAAPVADGKTDAEAPEDSTKKPAEKSKDAAAKDDEPASTEGTAPAPSTKGKAEPAPEPTPEPAAKVPESGEPEPDLSVAAPQAAGEATSVPVPEPSTDEASPPATSEGEAAPAEVTEPTPSPEPAAERPRDADADGREGRGRGKRRRVVIDAGAGRRGQGGPQGGRDRSQRRGPRPEGKPEERPSEEVSAEPVEVKSGASAKDISETLDVSTAQIIKVLMGAGEMVTITQSLSDDAIELLGDELKRPMTVVHAEEEVEREEEYADAPEDLESRAPVVTVMGHVDHGKTSLLDAIRKTEVAAGEAGGITQHIGAYQVHHGDRELTFLDTPGHEAFTAMRARGARITDVAVIVVAADDGVMPQTLEAIDHARAAEVPFLVAVNKIDKPDANADRVKQELSQQEVIPTDWGGAHEFADVSALEGTGIDDLLETILLVADADAEPKANPKPEASGTVIEARLDPGRGPVTSLLVQRGTMRVGDVLVVGEHSGRVRAMTDHTGAKIDRAGPSVPVEVLGIAGVADAGERFRQVNNEKEARALASERSQRLRAEELANRRPVSLDDLFARIKEGDLKELNIILKADTQGSVGALEDALGKIDQGEVRLRIIHTGVGGINESDVMLASASEAIIIGFNVRPRPETRSLAERESVDIRTYRVIYRAIDDVRDALVGMLEPDIVEDVTGSLEVRATFRSSRLGTIAGCFVAEGVVKRASLVRLIRDGTVVHEGKIGSLRRFDDDVREVQQGFECGVLIEGYNDVKEGDQIEAYELREVARTSQAASEPVAVE